MLRGIDTQSYQTKLLDLIAKEVKDTQVMDAFRGVPRHLFLTQGFHFYDRETYQSDFYTLDNTAVETWLGMIYQNVALLTQKFENGSPSSSSEPVLMAVMLEALDVQPGMHILELGTGTGYNTALLAHLTGKTGRVDSIDNQAHLIEQARDALKNIVDDTVHLHAGNGLQGLPEHAPYERIIATAGYSKVPESLINQLAIGGKLIMNIGTAGGLILLEKTAAGVRGNFLEQPGFFMQLLDFSDDAVQVLEGVNLEDLQSLDFRFYLNWRMPGVNYSAGTDRIIFDAGRDKFFAKLAQVDDKIEATYRKDDAQAERLIDYIRQWVAIGKTKRSDYSLHITDDGKQIIQILDAPDIVIEL